MHISSQLKDFKKDFFFVYMTKYTYQAKLGKIIYIIVYIQQVFCTANSNDNDIPSFSIRFRTEKKT